MDIDKALALIIEDIRRMWRFRWAAVACAWLAALGGWLAIRALPDDYDATARVYVNAGTVLKPLLQGLTVPTDAVEQVNLMTRALLSRPHLETVATATGMAGRARTQAQRDQMLERLRTAIQVQKIPNEQVYTISYRDHDPVMARAVVQTLLDDFMKKSLTDDVGQAVQAQNFLEGQIRIYEKRLTDAEDRLAAFKKKNMGLMPGGAGDFYGRFQAAQVAVESLQSQISALTNKRNELARQLSGEQPAAGTASVGGRGTTTVDAAIGNQENNLAQLRLKFTDKHPDVIRVRQTLEDLYRIRDEELKSRTGGGPAATAAREVDPVYQQMKMAVSNADADLAALRSQLAEKSGQVAYLRGMVNTIPEVEAQLNRLNRDYNVVKTEYETLLQRLESAKMNQEVQEDSKNVLFKILDPPHTPVSPASPNRLMLNTMVLLGALGFGLAIAFVLSQRDPTFFSETSLRSAASLPVYGLINIAGPAANLRKGWRFEIAVGGLLLLYALILSLGGPVSVIKGVTGP